MALPSTATKAQYIAEIARLDALVMGKDITIQARDETIVTLNATITTRTAERDAANATVATLQGQLLGLQSEVAAFGAKQASLDKLQAWLVAPEAQAWLDSLDALGFTLPFVNGPVTP